MVLLVMMTRHRERERERERERWAARKRRSDIMKTDKGFLSQEDSVGVIECLYYILT